HHRRAQQECGGLPAGDAGTVEFERFTVRGFPSIPAESVPPPFGQPPWRVSQSRDPPRGAAGSLPLRLTAHPTSAPAGEIACAIPLRTPASCRTASLPRRSCAAATPPRSPEPNILGSRPPAPPSPSACCAAAKFPALAR